MKFESLLIICISMLLQLQMGATEIIRVLKSNEMDHLRRREVMPPQLQGNSECFICLAFSTEYIYFEPSVPLSTLAPPNLDDSSHQWHPVSDAASTERNHMQPQPTRATIGEGYDSVIDDYLAKVDLTVADIKEEDGQLVTTIVDRQGRVLSVTFALSNDKAQ